MKRIVTIGGLIASAITLSACGGFQGPDGLGRPDPTFPAGATLTAFRNGMDKFCGPKNWASRDGSNRPLGGPTELNMTGVCATAPFGADEYTNRFAEAFPYGDVEYSSESDGSQGWDIHIPDNPAENRHSETISLREPQNISVDADELEFPGVANRRLGAGPVISWYYRISDTP